MAYETDRNTCIYSDPRAEPLYSAAQTYECKTFTSPTACEKCLSQVTANGIGHYWEYINPKDVSITSSITLGPDGIPLNEPPGLYVCTTSKPHKPPHHDGLKPSEETGEKEAGQCRYICPGLNDPNMGENHELFSGADDSPMKRL